MKNKLPFKYTILDYQSVIEGDELRLNASSYSPEIIRAKKLIDKLKRLNKAKRLRDFSEKVFVGMRTKRLFVDSQNGVPYLMPIDILIFPLKARKWVSKFTKDIENWQVKPLTILITQSGIPGQVILANKHFENKVVSPNVIRMVPNEEGLKIIGFIYAYLNTPIGQALITKTKYGVTVKHIEPYHVEEVPIPLLDRVEIEEINQLIMEAYKLKEMAQDLEERAIQLLQKKLEEMMD
jgi:type I restriction enzyme S subunit